MSDLQKITQNVDLSDMTRKHNIAMNGHIGHARNLSQSINFAEEKFRAPGWGKNVQSLK
jgi:hypothetical protein